MLIEKVHHHKKHIVEVWDEEYDYWEYKEVFGEEFYEEINKWCIKTLGYHARTAFNRFEFKTKKDQTIFLLKWS